MGSLYKLNNWTVTGVDYVTPQPYVMPTADSEYIILQPPANEVCYLSLTDNTAVPTIGNSMEVVAAFPDYGLVCDGNQEITTDIIPTENTSVKITAYIDVENASHQILFGNATDNSMGQFIFAVAGSGHDNISFTYGTNTATGDYIFTKSGLYTFTVSGPQVYINDELIFKHPGEFVTGDSPLKFFTSENSNLINWSGEVRGIKVTENDEEVLTLHAVQNGYLNQDDNLIVSSGSPFVSFTGPTNYYVDAPFQMVIDDGVNRAALTISRKKIKFEEEEFEVASDIGNTHTYTMALKEGSVILYYDRKYLGKFMVMTLSSASGKYIGYLSGQPTINPVHIKYLKETKKCVKYFNPDIVDFILEIDNVDTFDSPNKKTYRKADFINPPGTLEAWEPIELICGSKESGTYDLTGLVYAATVQMPERQPGQSYSFFYRVRFKSEQFTSDYAYSYLTYRVKPLQLEDEFMVLPEDPADGADYTITNTGSVPLTVFRYPYSEGIRVSDIPKYSTVRYTYDKATDNWIFEILHKQAKFLLPYDISKPVFEAVFKKTLPYDGEVYTTDLDSGEVANIINAKAHAEDTFMQYVTEQRRNLSVSESDIVTGNKRWETVFDLDESLFRNTAEERHAFQCMVENLKGQTMYKTMYNLIYDLTGCAPKITEYKDKVFNIIYSHAETIKKPLSDLYYLADDENISIVANPIILYDQKDRMPTWQIDIYDIYDIQYNKNVINKVIDMFKPAYTKAIVNFYDKDGVLIEERYTYGYANYLRSLFNK